MKTIIPFFISLSLIFIINAEFIKYEEDGQISLITIARPKALNALNSQVLDELDKTIDNIDTNKIRALIITGEGEKSFVAGADIAEMSTLTKKEAEQFSKKGNDVFRKIETFPIPVIAAVNGFALGGGCELSMSCDIRICSDNAIFGQPEVGLGITPGFGGTQRLSRLVGMGMAKQMIFTAKNIKADEALRIGLVNSIYPQNELLNEAKKLANSIAKNGQNAIKNSKKAINEGMQVDIDKAIEIEEKIFGDCFENSEQIDGMKNFLDKSKKGKTDKNKNLRENESKEEGPRGELVPTDKFLQRNIFKEPTLLKMPAVLTAGDKDKYNSMIIGMGSIGFSWGKPIFTVYVKPDRYTYEIIEKAKMFTVSIINKNDFEKFQVYGTKSGRDINKEEVGGTHIKFLDDGGITFDEDDEVYVCKMLAKAHFTDEDLSQEILDFYEMLHQKLNFTKEPHAVYMGEIIGHYIRNN